MHNQTQFCRRVDQVVAFGVGCSLLLGTLLSCSGKPQATVSVQLQVAGPRTASRDGARSGIRLPSNSAGFDCLLINIMGEGIPNRKPEETQASFPAILAGNYCSYPGVLSDFIAVPQGSAEASVQLKVPTGSNRVVQVLGLVFPGGCTGSIEDMLKDALDDGDKIAGIFELGRSIVDTRGNVSVAIPNNFDSATPREVTCQGRHRLVDCTKHTSSTPFAGGSGTANDPYAICTQTQLTNIASSLSASYFLGDDVALSGNWTPIGNSTTPFSGTFDGRNWEITGLSYTGTGDDTGLFGSISGTIENITVSGSIAHSGGTPDRVGLLAGESSAVVRNAKSSGSVSVLNGTNVGGLIGFVQGGSVSRCSSSATVYAETSAGGLIGTIDGAISPSVFVEKSFSTGAVSVGNSTVGGFVGGMIDGATAKNCYAKLNTALGGPATLGGFAGQMLTGANAENCYVIGAVGFVPIAAGSGGFVGQRIGVGNYSNVYSTSGLAASKNGAGDDGTPLSLSQMRDSVNFASNFMGFDFTSVWLPPDGTNSPTLRP